METTQINRRQPTEIYIHRDADPTISLFFDELDSDKQVQYLEELDAFQADFDRETSTEADKEAIRELESKSDHSAKRFLEERDLWTMKMGLLQKEVDYWKQTSTRSINSLSNCQNKRINAAFNKEQRLKHILYNQDMRAHRRRIDAEERAIHAVQSERVQTNQKLYAVL